MQQASSSIGNLAPATGNSLPPNLANVTRAPAVRFVVNLCASTTPVGLVQPSHAGLKRFTFFVSRRLEEGRERFRLHMGYFDSQEEAEKMLDLVRDVYPAAWAGAAPGIKLRARANETPPVAAQPKPVAAQPKAVAAIAPPAISLPAIAPQPAKVDAPIKLELVPDLPRAAAHSLDSIRATIESLEDTGQRLGSAALAPGTEGTAVLRLLESSAAPRVAPTTPAIPHIMPAIPVAPLAVVLPVPVPPVPAKTATASAEVAVFAVQLLWSVQPIDMNQVPQLAIFSAYTLYGAEGNRDGRRWYGLRLGFFTDAVSAKQVAQYVRSEFTSVSVVPVTTRERTRAGAAAAKPLPALPSNKRSGPELNFIEDVQTDTATSGSRPALKVPDADESPAVRAAAAALGLTAHATPGKRAKARGAQGTKPVSKRPNPGRPLSLEETLEILGAGDLSVDHGRGERLNDSSKRERKTSTPGGSRFGRLINRLAERLGSN